MLLAFAASPHDIEILLLSITFGNVDVQKFAEARRHFSFSVPLLICF